MKKIIIAIVIGIFVFIVCKGGIYMAKIKISELNEKTQINDDDLLPVVDVISNETKKMKKSNLIKDDYSASESRTNKRWIDGKPIYRTVVNIGDTTDATRWQYGTLTIYTNISSAFETLTSIQVIGKLGVDEDIKAYLDITDWVFTEIGTNNIGIVNWSVYNTGTVMLFGQTATSLWPGDQNVVDGYAIIEYTKSTD